MSFLTKLFGSHEASSPKGSTDASTPQMQQPPTVKMGSDDSPQYSKDFDLLLGIKRQLPDIPGPDLTALVLNVNKDAKNNTCPYCNNVFAFTASRARKCPSCSEHMVVRRECFLTDQQASELDNVVKLEWDKRDLSRQLGFALQAAQNAGVRKNLSEQYTDLADAFRFAAQFADQKDERGFSFWDKAWSYYNRARTEAMRSSTADSLAYCLPQIFWQMNQSLLDQANHEKAIERKNKGMKQTLKHTFMILAESSKFGAQPYFIPELYKRAKIIALELNVSKEDLRSMSDIAAATYHLQKDSLLEYEKRVAELNEYQIINP